MMYTEGDNKDAILKEMKTKAVTNFRLFCFLKIEKHYWLMLLGGRVFGVVGASVGSIVVRKKDIYQLFLRRKVC